MVLWLPMLRESPPVILAIEDMPPNTLFLCVLCGGRIVARTLVDDESQHVLECTDCNRVSGWGMRLSDDTYGPAVLPS